MYKPVFFGAETLKHIDNTDEQLFTTKYTNRAVSIPFDATV